MARDEFWDALKEFKKEQRRISSEDNLNKADANDDGMWTKHTDYHWSRKLNGKRLDYWPSRSKFKLAGWNYPKIGDVMKFIASQSA